MVRELREPGPPVGGGPKNTGVSRPREPTRGHCECAVGGAVHEGLGWDGMTDESDTDLQARLQQYAARIEELAKTGDVDPLSREGREQVRAVLRSVPERDNEAFFRLVMLKVAHLAEKVEFDAETLQRIRREPGD